MNATNPKLATKVEDNGAPITNATAQEIETRKTRGALLASMGKAEATTMVNAITAEVRVSDGAAGNARAMAVVTLVLMLKHKLILQPTKRNLGNKDGDKAFGEYIASGITAIGMDWTELKAKSPGINSTWTDALAGYAWLTKIGCLRTDLDEKKEGNLAHLGLCKDKKTGEYTIALDIDIMEAAEVAFDNEKVKGPGGVKRASAAEVIAQGKALLDSAEYWKRDSVTVLDFIGRFEAYCIAIGNEVRPEEGPTPSAGTLKRLKEAAEALRRAIHQMEKTVKANADKTAAMNRERNRPPATDKVVKLAPRGKAKSKAPTKRAKAA